jgi:Ran GTPase-activating protein (RanGAP) involved in mRNA processing and transport
MMGNWINVKYLTLGSNGLTAKGIKTLLKKDNLQSLKHLYLNDNLLDANAGSVLADAIWAKIEIINLNFNSLGSLGLKTLQKNTWKTLKELYLLKNNITN